eukprot:Sspe_Gene.72889::Locus_43689_Transcript_1_1_Confidence_1.000_Length_422::g.72889::m.72889
MVPVGKEEEWGRVELLGRSTVWGYSAADPGSTREVGTYRRTVGASPRVVFEGLGKQLVRVRAVDECEAEGEVGGPAACTEGKMCYDPDLEAPETAECRAVRDDDECTARGALACPSGHVCYDNDPYDSKYDCVVDLSGRW